MLVHNFKVLGLSGKVLVALFLVNLHSGPVRADDTAGTTVKTGTDVAASYLAKGRFTTNDTDTPPNGIDGPEYSPTTDIHWKFWIKHIVPDWIIQDADPLLMPPLLLIEGADEARIELRGTHKIGPHDEDIDPNPLPMISTPPVDVTFSDAVTAFGTRKVGVWNTVAHPTEDDVHFDGYGVLSFLDAAKLSNPVVHRITNKTLNGTTVKAKHSGDLAELASGFSNYVCGKARPTDGSTLSYAPGAGALRLELGTLSVLDRTGCQSGGIDPAYAGDPVLSATSLVVDLFGPIFDPARGYVFNGGSLQLVDPAGQFVFQTVLEDFVVSAGGTGGNAGWFRTVSYSDVADASDNPSKFLSDFVDVNLFGIGIADSEWRRIQATGLSFTSDIDIVLATNGFTQGVIDLPVTFYLGAGLSPPCVCNLDVNLDGQVDPFDADQVMFCLDNPAGEGCHDLDPNCDGMLDAVDFDDVFCSVVGGASDVCCTPVPCDSSTCDDSISCTHDSCALGVCSSQSSGLYADVNGNGFVELNDALCHLDAFAGIANSPACVWPDGSLATLEDRDIAPCGGNGFDDLDDTLATLDAFAGIPGCVGCADGCWCDVDDAADSSGMGGEGAEVGPTTLLVPLQLVAERRVVRPGDLVRVHALVKSVDALRGYQLGAPSAVGRRGSLELESVYIDESRKDGVFPPGNSFTAANQAAGQVLNALGAGGVTVSGAAYLATFEFRVARDAAGPFVIALSEEGTKLRNERNEALAVAASPATVWVSKGQEASRISVALEAQ